MEECKMREVIRDFFEEEEMCYNRKIELLDTIEHEIKVLRAGVKLEKIAEELGVKDGYKN